MGSISPRNQPGATEQALFFLPERYLIYIVKRAVANKQDIKITLPGAGSIILLTQRGEYIDNSSDLKLMCTADVDQFEITVLVKNELHEYSSIVGRNIDELLWHAGYHASNGRLMEGCSPLDIVQLRHWPNVSRIPINHNTMRIAALLTNQPTSIMVAEHLLKIDAAELYQFYSAARCAGIAHILNHKPVDPILKPHRNRALLGLLLNRIAGL